MHRLGTNKDTNITSQRIISVPTMVGSASAQEIHHVEVWRRTFFDNIAVRLLLGERG
jgi:hypothetical protein